MRISVRGAAIALSLIWGGALMSLSLAHFASGAYAASFLEAISSIYPGFHGGRTIGDVILGTVYALIDGALGGLIFAWLYNLFAPRTA